MTLGTQLLTLPQIFEGNFFIVPDYQRGYAWERKQVEDLLQDIDHLMDDGVELRHYTGTLVLSRPEGVANGEFHVVDGQQRVTTLVILMKLISEQFPSSECNALIERYVRRGDPGCERAVLQLNADTRQFFESVVLRDSDIANQPATLEAHKRLYEARNVIAAWLAEYLRESKPVRNILNAVEKELGFLVYAPKEDAETGIMFEVINNRGKPLSELEKVKNYLIYCSVKLSAPMLRRSIDDNWSVILRHLNAAKKTSPADEGAFLRYCVAVFLRLGKDESQYGYEQLKKKISIDDAMKDGEQKRAAIKQIENLVRFLGAAALWYARLYGQQHGGVDIRLIPVLNLIRAQERHASIMPLFLALVIKEHLLRDQRLESLLSLLEVMNFRVYMAHGMTLRNDSGQADLYGYATSYYHSSLLQEIPTYERRIGNRVIESEDDALEYRLVSFVLKHATDDRFRESFKLEADSPYDFYYWRGLRYFLMNYEVDLQPHRTISFDKIHLSRIEGKSADYLSVEHLWAGENRNLAWENRRVVDAFEKRRLGNFVLLELRLNIQGGADGLEAKLPRYLSGYGKGFDNEPPTELTHVRKMGQDAKRVLKSLADDPRTKNYYLRFYRALNELQENRYSEFAEERWSVKEYLGYEQIVAAASIVVTEEE